MTLKKSNYGFLLILFIASFMVRAVVFQRYLSRDNNYWQVDSRTYDKVAQQIALGQGMTQDDGSHHFYRVPGYPLFLALCYKLFGVDHYSTLWVQIFLASCIPLLIFFLAQVLFKESLLTALLAASYAVVHLGLVLYSGFLMTESLFLLVFLLFCIIFIPLVRFRFCIKNKVLYRKKSNHDVDQALRFLMLGDQAEYGDDFAKTYEDIYGNTLRQWYSVSINSEEQRYNQEIFFRLVGSGLFLGYASLIRPVGHYLVIVSMVMLIVSYDYWSEKIYKSTVFFLAWLLPVSYWLIRSYALTGYIFFHTLPGGHFLYLSAARVAMYVHNVDYQQARNILRNEVKILMDRSERKKGKPLLEIERCVIHEKLAIKYFLKRPFITIKCWFTDIFRTSFPLFSAELLYLESGRKQIDYFAKGRPWRSMFEPYLFPQTTNKALKVIVYTELVLFLLAMIGMFGFVVKSFYQWLLLNNASNMCVLLLIVPFITLFIIISLAGGYARMRLPIEPFLTIFASNFWVSILSSRR